MLDTAKMWRPGIRSIQGCNTPLSCARYEQYEAALANERAFQRRYMSLPFDVPDAKLRKNRFDACRRRRHPPGHGEGLARLKPVKPGGTVTFGAQTHPADGNAAAVVTSGSARASCRGVRRSKSGWLASGERDGKGAYALRAGAGREKGAGGGPNPGQRIGRGQKPQSLHRQRHRIRQGNGLRRDPKIALRYLVVDHPVVHLEVHPDGSTNIPPPGRPRREQNAVQQLVVLAVGRIQLSHGVLLLNDRVLPLNISASDVELLLSYVLPDKRYEGALKIGKFATQYKQWQPVTASAEATFSLSQRGALFKSLKVTSGQSVVQASGELRDWPAPKITASYVAQLDVPQLGLIASIPELRQGRVWLQGQGTADAAGFASTGKLTVRELDYANRNLHVTNAAAASDFSVTRDKLVFSHLVANVFGGAVAGDIDISNWSGRQLPPRVTERGGPAATPQAGVARLTLRDLSLPRVAAAASTSAMPWDRAKLAGAATGTIDAHWTGAVRNLVAQLAININSPATVAAGELPVTALLRGTYEASREQLGLQQLSVSTPATRLNATGVLAATSSSLHLAVSSTDVGEWQPLLRVFDVSRQLPVEVHGRAAFDGNVSGRFSQPTVAGHIEFTNFDTLIVPRTLSGAPVAPPGVPARRAHWDSVTANIAYSPSAAGIHNALLRHGRAQIGFDFSTQLRRGSYSQSMPFTLQAHIRNGDVSELLGIGGYSYPVTGTLNLNLRASGTQADPQGSGHLLLTNGTLYGEQLQRISSDIRFARHEAELSNIRLQRNGGAVSGSASYNLVSTAFRFNLRGEKFNLAAIHALQIPRLTVAGVLGFNATGSGTTAAPSINASAQLQNLVMNGETMGNFRLAAATTNDVMQFNVRSDNSQLVVEGTTQLRGDYPATLSIRMDRLDVDPLIRAFLKGRPTADSAMVGTITVQGPLRKPAELTATGNIEQFSAEMQHIPVHNEGSHSLHGRQPGDPLRAVSPRGYGYESDGPRQSATERAAGAGLRRTWNFEFAVSAHFES